MVGDGGLSMSLAELATCRKYYLPIKIIVINNSTLGQIQWEQTMFLGHPEFGCALEPVDFARIADGCSLKGLRITRSDECAGIRDEAFAHDGPVLVDAPVDAAEPMLPPKRRDNYVNNMKKALNKCPRRVLRSSAQWKKNRGARRFVLEALESLADRSQGQRQRGLPYGVAGCPTQLLLGSP